MWLNPQDMADLDTFTEEIPNGKLHFLCFCLDIQISSSSEMKDFITMKKHPLNTTWSISFYIKCNRKWVTNKQFIDKTKNIWPNFYLLLFGLERENTTNSFLQEIESNIVVPFMSSHLYSLLQQCLLK